MCWLQGGHVFFVNLLKNFLFHRKSSGIADGKIRELRHTCCMKGTGIVKKSLKTNSNIPKTITSTQVKASGKTLPIRFFPQLFPVISSHH